MPFSFAQPLYPIVGDSRSGIPPLELADQVIQAGARLLQLRLKDAPTGEFVEVGRELQRRCLAHRVTFIVNDRVDIAELIGADGVHLGQDDLSPNDARAILGPHPIIGFSTHNADQFASAHEDPAVDYVAYGPIFTTGNKANPDPVRGLDDLQARAAAGTKPLVAIGGIDASNMRSVLAAGADAVAVIGAIADDPTPAKAVEKLLALAGDRATR